MSRLTVDAVGGLGLVEEWRRYEVPSGAEWDELLDAVIDERAVPLLGMALDSGAIAELSAAQRQCVIDAHEARMRACLMLERVSLEVVETLHAAGVDARLLKGPATAHLDYPDPAWRGFGDVDVLVRSGHYDAAVSALTATGARRRSAEVRAGFDRRFGKGVCLIRPDAVQVDLHRTLVSGPFGLTIQLEDLFEDCAWFALAGRPVPALPRELRFLHACFHAILGDVPARLTALRDVGQIGTSDALDIDRALATARRWRSGIVVSEAVRVAWERFELPESSLSRWSAGYRPSRFERRALAAYTGPNRSYARQMIAGVPAVRGLRAKVAYIRALLVADSAYAASHDGGYARRVRRALSIWRSALA